MTDGDRAAQLVHERRLADARGSGDHQRLLRTALYSGQAREQQRRLHVSTVEPPRSAKAGDSIVRPELELWLRRAPLEVESEAFRGLIAILRRLCQ